MKKTAAFIGIMLFVLALGCSRVQTDEILLPQNQMYVGDWWVGTIDGQTPTEMFNTDTDQNLKNDVEITWTFHPDGVSKSAIHIITTFPDTPELQMEIWVNVIGTYTQKDDILSIVVEEITAHVDVTPAENTEILLGTDKSSFEKQYAENLRQNDIFTGDYHWTHRTYPQDELILTEVNGRKIECIRLPLTEATF